MTGGIWDRPFESPEAVAAALHQAFPAYSVWVRRDRGQPPRYELLSRDGRNPVVLISADPDEIRAEMNGASSGRPTAVCARDDVHPRTN